MVCASVAASDVYHDANVYLQDYYRKLPMTNAFMPSSSYGGRDIINDEQDILTTVTSDIIQCITLLLHDSRIKHHRFDAHRRKTRLRSTKNLNRFGMTPTPSTVRNSPSSRIREGIYSTFVLAIFPNMVYFFQSTIKDSSMTTATTLQVSSQQSYRIVMHYTRSQIMNE